MYLDYLERSDGSRLLSRVLQRRIRFQNVDLLPAHTWRRVVVVHTSVPVHFENLDPAAGGLRQLDPTAFSVCAVLVNAPSAR